MPKIVARKEDWIVLGYELFTAQGKHGIVIDSIAKKLACNRSSFYWHFKTKKAFISEIVDYWVGLETKNIIQLIDKKKSAKEKFHTLIVLSFKKNPYLDFVFYVKKYALENEEVQVAIRGIDDSRKECVYSILTELGFSNKEAIIKISLFYKFLIGYHETIRYRKQSKNYVEEVMEEMKHFIQLD